MPKKPKNEYIWILMDADDSGDLAEYSGPVKIDAKKLGEHLEKFTSSMSKALDKCKSIDKEYELSEVTIDVKLSAEAGFVLVSKAGVEGTIGLKFIKNKRKKSD
jgi:hypothetical protein